MKAHIARNQFSGVPTLLLWNFSTGDRGKMDGIADAFQMRVVPVAPDALGRTVDQLLGQPGTGTAFAGTAAPTPAMLMANFTDKQVDDLLALCRQMEVNAPLKCLATASNRRWTFGYLLEHLAEEHAAFQSAQAKQ